MPSKYAADFLLDRILHRDGLILVINKPAGLPVHAKPGPHTKPHDNLENYFDALRFGLPRAPALAHRLDTDTTGCLVLGRHPKALRKLGKLFASGAVEKTYLAICKGRPDAQSGSIEAPLAKTTSKKDGWKMIIANDGKPARTTYRVLRANDRHCLIEAKPKTGRTHQIRVHLAHIGAPIVGDYLYDEAYSPKDGSLALHAKRILLPLSASKPAICIEAPTPSAFHELFPEAS